MKAEEKNRRIQKKLDRKGLTQEDLERQKVINAGRAIRDRALRQFNIDKKNKLAQDQWEKTVLKTHHTRIRNRLRRKMRK